MSKAPDTGSLDHHAFINMWKNRRYLHKQKLYSFHGSIDGTWTRNKTANGFHCLSPKRNDKVMSIFTLFHTQQPLKVFLHVNARKWENDVTRDTRDTWKISGYHFRINSLMSFGKVKNPAKLLIAFLRVHVSLGHYSSFGTDFSFRSVYFSCRNFRLLLVGFQAFCVGGFICFSL